MIIISNQLSKIGTKITIGCEPNILVNQATGEVYIRIQPFLEFEPTTESIGELTAQGFEIKNLNFEAPVELEIPYNTITKTLNQSVDTGDFQVFMLWQTSL